MASWIPGDTINCVYLALVGLGLLYTVISLIGADFGSDVDIGGPDIDFHIGDIGLGGVHVPDVDLDVDSPEVDVGGGLHFPSISPFVISSFFTGFGAVGMIANLAFNVTAPISLIWAFFGGLIIGGAMQFFYGSVLLKSQGSSEIQVSKLGGIEAEVTVPIENGGNGQIAFVNRGRRVTFTARASSGNVSLPRGAQVEIVRIVGGTAIVRLLEKQ